VPLNGLAYLKLNLDMEGVVEFFGEFWLWKRLERIELEEEAILQIIG